MVSLLQQFLEVDPYRYPESRCLAICLEPHIAISRDKRQYQGQAYLGKVQPSSTNLEVRSPAKQKHSYSYCDLWQTAVLVSSGT